MHIERSDDKKQKKYGDKIGNKLKKEKEGGKSSSQQPNSEGGMFFLFVREVGSVSVHSMCIPDTVSWK